MPRKNAEVVDIKDVKPTQRRAARPASTPEAREQQMVGLAVELAEKQLRDGTASAAVITHYLKLASERERLERKILENQSKLLDVKATSIEKAKEDENLSKAAIEAMKKYTSSSN